MGDSEPGAAAREEEEGTEGEREGGAGGVATPDLAVTRLQLMLPGLRLTCLTSCGPERVMLLSLDSNAYSLDLFSPDGSCTRTGDDC